jgi:hypothetical protein
VILEIEHHKRSTRLIAKKLRGAGRHESLPVAHQHARWQPSETLRVLPPTHRGGASVQFKEHKHELSIRPLHHQLNYRIEANIFISFLAYALQVTLKARLKQSAKGLTPRSALEKFATIQMLDVHLPTSDGREIIMTRHTLPEKDL